MRKKLVRKKIKMFTAIISIFLLISMVVSGIYVYITYQTQKDLLYKSAQSRYGDFIDAWESSLNDEYFFYSYYNHNRAENSEFIITKNDESISNINYCAFDFVNDKKEEVFGYLYFDEFKELFTDEQYNEITSYLNSTDEEKDREFYQLVCSEYYAFNSETNDTYDENGKSVDPQEATEDEIVVTNINMSDNIHPIYPKTVKIVLTEDGNSWNVQDTTIKSYELNVTPPENYTLYKEGDMSRNLINTDFALGKYSECSVIDELIDHLGINWTPNQYQSEDLFQIDAFNYIYYKMGTYYYMPDDVSENSVIDVSQYTITKCQYAEKFNVLDHCIDSIGVMFIYTLILFLLAGTIVAVMSWRTVKKQIVLEERRRDMINSMAHDLKTPLFIISGYAENLIECVKDADERAYAKAIVEQTNSMNEMVYTMLDISRINSENFTPNTEIFSLADLVSDILLHYNNFYTEFIIGYACNSSAEISADKKLIECVIRNFIENSLKYTDDKNSINIVLDEHKFSISNSISSDSSIDVKHIWEPDKRKKNEEKTGNGLGLSLAKSVLEIHKFKYKAEISNSTITFSFEF